MTRTELTQTWWYAPLISDEAIRPTRTSPQYEGPEYLSDEFFRLAEWSGLAALRLLSLQDDYPASDRDVEDLTDEELLKLLVGAG